MCTRRFCLSLLCVALPWGAAAADIPLADPWQTPYTGTDAQGSHVLGLWQFDASGKAADASSHAHDGTLDGAKIVAEGRFGACLESDVGHPVADQRHRALVKSRPALSPKGAFTIEMWVKPKAALAGDYPDAFLLDKKYVSQSDYQLILGKAEKSGARTLRACLGFGDDSANWYSLPLRLLPGTWYHLAFTYDGEGGGAFYLDGVPHGSRRIAGRRNVTPGTQPLSIGDRVGSYFHGFPGYLDQVRICSGVREFRQVKFEQLSERAVFRRLEPQAMLRFAVTNLQRRPLEGAQLSVTLAGGQGREFAVKQLAAGATVNIDYPLDTSLRPDEYTVATRLTIGGAYPLEAADRFQVRIVARPVPDRFPVLMWGVYGRLSDEMERLKQAGFTHALGLGADYAKIWEAGKPDAPAAAEHLAEAKQMLNAALANDMTVVASLSPGSYLAKQPEWMRVDRKGVKKTEHSDVCGLFPEAQKFCYNVGASVAQAYGQFPAFGAALIHTEVRDHATLCFHDHDREAYRKATGLEIPADATGRHGVQYAKLANFPASRVIPDDHPLLLYYRWFWKQGDGWNDLNTAVHRGLKSTGRKDLWTFHDPAVRTARVFGNGGEVDVLSQWTYSYPDPVRIGLATDELLATAAGRPGQQVMKMTQIIWYRTQTAPQPKAGQAPLPFQAAWELEQPDAPFITISPMHLRECLWTKIARPIKGIMYHGWQSLFPCEGSTGYRHTHPQTKHELARLVREVIRPLGPTLLAVPPVQSNVAILESFAAEMFAGRGTYGWGRGWAGDVYHVLQYAHLQPDIVLDETIVMRGLDGYQVLVAPDCDVLTQSVAEQIKKFQARGGIVIGDEHLAPAIKADFVLPTYLRTGRAADDRAALVKLAGEVRQKLGARCPRRIDIDTPDVIPYLRRYHQADYVFLVNDRREYGQYVGQHGIVMENGLPAQAAVTLRRPAGVVYDLLEGRQVACRKAGDGLVFDAQLGPCDGRLLLVCEQPLAGVTLKMPSEIERGKTLACTVRIVDAQGRPIDAIIPVDVALRDPEGRLAEFSGYYAAAGGQLTLRFDIAANDLPGAWELQVRELAGRNVAQGTFRVKGPQPWPPTSKPVDKSLANPVQPNG